MKEGLAPGNVEWGCVIGGYRVGGGQVKASPEACQSCAFRGPEPLLHPVPLPHRTEGPQLWPQGGPPTPVPVGEEERPLSFLLPSTPEKHGLRSYPEACPSDHRGL